MWRPVSIVTVSFDTYFFVRLLVEKVREHVGARPYEIIVVDRGSCDGTREWLAVQRDVRIINTPAQRRGHGHGEAAELGVAEAKHEHIVLLDSDAHPIADDWLKLTVDKLDGHHRLAGPIFEGRHKGNPLGWYIHPHFMAFHKADVPDVITLRKVRGDDWDTAEAATVHLVQARRGVLGYPLALCARFAVGHPHFPTESAGVFHAWYGTRLLKEKRAVNRETQSGVTSKSYGQPLQALLRSAYQLDY